MNCFIKGRWSSLALALLCCGYAVACQKSSAHKADGPMAPKASQPTLPAPEQTSAREIFFHNAEAQLKDLASYRVHYLYKDTEEAPRANFVEFVRESIKATGDKRLYLNQQGGIASGVMESYQIGGQAYFVVQDNASGKTGAAKGPGEARLPFEQIDVCNVTGFRRARLVAENESLNGIAADHYRYETPAPPTRWDLSTLKGDIWLARDGGFVVKYLIEGTNIDRGVVRWEYTVEAVNSIEKITPP